MRKVLGSKWKIKLTTELLEKEWIVSSKGLKKDLLLITMFNIAVAIFMPTCTVPRRKGKPKRNPIIKQNFIKVIFIFVNILPGFHRDFCVCENNEYITEKHYIFLLGV